MLSPSRQNPQNPVDAPPAPRYVGPVFWPGMRALIYRDMKRFTSNKTYHLLVKLVVAMLFVLVFHYALPQDGEAGTAVGLEFIIPGLILFALMSSGAEGIALSIMIDKMEGAITDIYMPPLGALELTLGFIVAGTIRAMVTGVFVCLGLVLIWGMPIVSIPVLGLVAFLTATMVAAMSLLAGQLSDKWDHYNVFFTFLFMPLAFLSGMFAPVEAYTPVMQPVIRLSPFYYAFDGFRGGFIGVSESGIMVCAAVLCGVTILLSTCCYMVFKTGYRIKT